MKIVIALGGNAILQKGEKQSYSTLLKNIKKTCKQIIPIIKNNKVVITHGNGPQVGYLALQNEIAKKEIPQMPLDVLGAESQALIGYIFEEQLRNTLRENKINLAVANIITQVLVNKKDKAFKHPTKPIGPFYTKFQSQALVKKGFKVVNDANRGYRRVVPSPLPIKILEIDIIKKLVDNKVIVIAAGGGGIPVYNDKGKLKGIEAVIDKDHASQVLANAIKADLLLILTGTPYIYLNYMEKTQRPLFQLTTKEAQYLIDRNEFEEGNIKPKLQAAINFVKKSGKRAVITTPENAVKALNNQAGTNIVE